MNGILYSEEWKQNRLEQQMQDYSDYCIWMENQDFDSYCNFLEGEN